ncbi:MinD/ParA family ATP-binding protein (plasmid) [Nocardia sp. CA-084685]|uniref:MinD/ParA family ATP-binding protein n=1 Tax=Nocardia sp. CA-084685 TaxID=3239970 RepID=UPI003D970450
MSGDWVVRGIQPPSVMPVVGPIMHLVRAEPPSTPPVLVVSGCGGGGATTTTLGLASHLAAAVRAVAVDATVAGGDLVLRGADAQLVLVPMQAWLAGAHSNRSVSLGQALSQASSGAALLARDPGPLPRRATIATVCERLITEALTPIVDGGAAVHARHLRPLLDQPGIRLVLSIPARHDAANRLRWTMQILDAEFGEDLIASTVLVISHQTPNTPAVGAALAEHYAGWVSAVVEVPFDAHLATGQTITHASLHPQTRDAYTELAAHVMPEAERPQTRSAHG